MEKSERHGGGQEGGARRKKETLCIVRGRDSEGVYGGRGMGEAMRKLNTERLQSR